MNLKDNDFAVLAFLRNQGVALHKHVGRRFYNSPDYGRKRLKALEKYGLIEVLPISKIHGVLPKVREILFRLGTQRHIGKTLVVRPKSMVGSAQVFSKFSHDDYLAHQVLVGEVDHYFRSQFLNVQIITEPELLFLSSLAKRPEDYYPDLTAEWTNELDHRVKIAIEVERTRKPKKKIASKLRHYRNSNYTHIIYFCSTLEIAQLVMNQGRLDPKLAVGLISDLENLYTREGSVIPLQEFISKRFNKFSSELSFQEVINQL